MRKQETSPVLKCLIIDDEPLAIELLKSYIERVPFLQLDQVFDNPLEGLMYINQHESDLILLDIQMPQLSGIQFMQLLQNRAQVIVSSAYKQYAIDGYEHNITDYLLKPVSFERFLKAIEKAISIKYPNQAQPPEAEPPHSVTGGYIFVKVETRMLRVDLDDILFIEGLKNYVSIQTSKKRIITLQVMKQLESLLPGTRFARVHKSFIVALDKIDSIERQEIHINDRIIPIGITYQEHFNKMLNAKKS